jgi:hypothetical protein
LTVFKYNRAKWAGKSTFDDHKRHKAAGLLPPRQKGTKKKAAGRNADSFRKFII